MNECVCTRQDTTSCKGRIDVARIELAHAQPDPRLPELPATPSHDDSSPKNNKKCISAEESSSPTVNPVVVTDSSPLLVRLVSGTTRS